MYLYTYTYASIFVREIPKSGITRKYTCSYNIFDRYLSNCQPDLFYQFIFPSAMWQRTYFSVIFPVLCIVNLFYLPQCHRLKMVSHHGLNMFLSYFESDWNIFPHVSHLSSLFCEFSICVLFLLLVLLLVYSHFYVFMSSLFVHLYFMRNFLI